MWNFLTSGRPKLVQFSRKHTTALQIFHISCYIGWQDICTPKHNGAERRAAKVFYWRWAKTTRYIIPGMTALLDSDKFIYKEWHEIISGGKRKPSFKMVSNMVIQLLHSIKFSMEVPFSNMTQQPVEMQKTLQTKKVKIKLSSAFDPNPHFYKHLNGDIGPVGHFQFFQ